MTIESAVSRNSYAGNGTTANYAYNFKIFNDSDLRVFVIDDSTGASTTLTINTDYTVNGAGTTSGGTIDLVDASQAWIDASSFLDTGYTLVIRRVVPVKQLTDIKNLGDFYPRVHEDAMDYLTTIDQQQDDELNRSLQLAETVDPADFNPEIPATFVGESNVTFMTNLAGDGIVIGPSAAAISAAASEAAAAAASAAAAATSETNAGTSETNASNSAAAAAASAAEAAVNINEVSTIESITASGTISHSDEARQYRPIQGDSGAVTTSATPFGTNPANFTDGMEITLVGKDATNKVTIPTNDAQYGVVSPTASVVLGKYFSVTYVYDAVSERFIEKCRNH